MCSASIRARISLTICICAASVVAQQSPPKIAPAHSRASDYSDPTPEDLLQRSYVSGRSFPLEERCSQLFSLAHASGQIKSARARAQTKSWSRELFRRASDMSAGWNRSAWQKNSLEALSTVDPVSAFKLLPSVEEANSGNVATTSEDLRAFAAQRIFSRFWEVKGPSALEPIKSEARAIGRTGEYPYEAMGIVSNRLMERKDLDDVLLIFREALDFYGRGPRVRSANTEFITYLEGDWSYLPAPLQREALGAVVEHLTRKQDEDPTIVQVTRVATDRGAFSLQGDKIALLYRVLPKVWQVDPEWAKNLESEYPDLKQTAVSGAPQYTSSMTVINPSGASPDQVAKVLDSGLQAGVLGRLKQQALNDPEQASNLLSSISDPDLQSEGLSSLAAGFATKDPSHAADLLTSAQKIADKLPDKLSKLRALTALAQSAIALGDFQRADQAMEKAFDLGEELLSEDLDMHPGETVHDTETFEELSALTESAAQFAFRPTLARIEQLRDETLHAYLLIAAAEGLEKRRTVSTGLESGRDRQP